MMTPFWLTLAATILTGLLAGASLDQSIKQLPARRSLGVKAYSLYSRASDLRAGKPFYGLLGIGSAGLTIAAAVAVHRASLPNATCFLLDLGVLFAVLHSLVTMRAAPILLSQHRFQADPGALTQLLDRFARWQALRAGLQVTNFLTLLGGLVAVVEAR
jgi:hypothetical protein